MAAIVLAAAASSAASAAGWGAFATALASGAAGFAGGFIDRAIFGQTARIHQEGSRLTDLKVQASTYGKAIPIIYGNSRIAGNVIWSQPIQEHVTTTTQSSGGGKGGGGGGSVETTTTSYTYTCSLAVAICEGRSRKWCAYGRIPNSSILRRAAIGFISAMNHQLPDTYLASFAPAGQTSAYRGMAYVVIKDFPLADFGNRIPNFTFEVRRTLKKAVDVEDKITEISMIPGAGEICVRHRGAGEATYGQQDVSGNFVQGGKVAKQNLNNLSNKADCAGGAGQSESHAAERARGVGDH
jgi:hypothetical protein